MCVHLARCIIKAPVLPRKKEGVGEGGVKFEDGEGGEACGETTG